MISREAFGYGSRVRGNEIAAQATNYPFLAAVKPWAEQAEAMANKDDGNQKSVYDEVKAFEARYGGDLADLPADLVAPVRTLLASEPPYAGGLIPQATNAMTEQQEQLEQRLEQTQAKALR